MPKKNEFQCEYCPRTFTRRGAFRNHLKKHRNQMFLEENELTREEVFEPTTISSTTMSSTTIRNTSQKTVLPFILTEEILYKQSLDINNTNIMDTEVRFKNDLKNSHDFICICSSITVVQCT